MAALCSVPLLADKINEGIIETPCRRADAPPIHGACDLRTQRNHDMQRVVVNDWHFPDA